MKQTLLLFLLIGAALWPVTETTPAPIWEHTLPVCRFFAGPSGRGFLHAREKPRGLDIYWCDVEGGAATLIITPTGESILIDSGWPDERGAARIAHVAQEVAGLKQIDHAITTHWHIDHVGGIGELSRLIPVRRFYDRGLPESSQSDVSRELIENYKRVADVRRTVLKPGDEIPLKQAPGAPKLTLKVVAANGLVIGEPKGSPQIRACSITPPHPAKPLDEGDDARSLAFLLTFGGWEFFDAGDLSWNVEHKLVCPKDLVGQVDVYQVTCHGAAASNHPAILQVLRPRLAIMNNGARKGGHATVVRAVKEIVGSDAFFALHRNVQTGPEDNALPELTANDEENCGSHYIKLSVAPDAHSYAVMVPSKKTIKTFTTQTRTHFKTLASESSPEQTVRFRGLFQIGAQSRQQVLKQLLRRIVHELVLATKEEYEPPRSRGFVSPR